MPLAVVGQLVLNVQFCPAPKQHTPPKLPNLVISRHEHHVSREAIYTVICTSLRGNVITAAAP